MRSNLPVTAIEYPIGTDVLIVSRTDEKGRITYVNDDFVAASGFSEEELIGQPHNLIRHPDMPPEAFADLWSTLKDGKPWTGAVKNRRKNGDFYWVLASATPIWESGRIVGYMSIRSSLPADQRDEAERVYAMIRAKQPHRYALAAGILRRRTAFERFSMFTSTLKRRLITMFASLSGFMLMIGLIGIFAAYNANGQLRSVYNDRAVPLAQLFDVNNLMQANILALYGAATDRSMGRRSDEIATAISNNIAAISKAWDQFVTSSQTPEAMAVAEAYQRKRRDYVEQGLKPGSALLVAGKFDDLAKHVAQTLTPLFAAAKADAEKLVAIQIAEAKAAYDSAQHSYRITLGISIGALLTGILLGGIVGMLTIRAIGGPIDRLIGLMKRIAQGEFNNRVIIDNDDEIGVALRHLQAMQAKLGFDREMRRQEEVRGGRRTEQVVQLVKTFDVEVGEMLQTVASQATELRATAQSMSSVSEEMARQSATVSAASEQTSANVRSVALSTEEMSASIDEIARQVQEASRTAAEAVRQAKAADSRIAELSVAAERIGDVTNLISTIAGQTNLLALNATIEAARAGEAGKGFAVVAQEVKALATQTANATREIADQIGGMQSATQDSVAAIKQVGLTIAGISEIASILAASVEQQGVATREIASNVQQAALGTGEVTSNITQVNTAAQETGAAAGQVLSSAGELSHNGERLKGQVDEFLRLIRAA